MNTFATTALNQQRSGLPIHDTMATIEFAKGILLYSQSYRDQVREIRDVWNNLVDTRDGFRINLAELIIHVTAMSATIGLLTTLLKDVHGNLGNSEDDAGDDAPLASATHPPRSATKGQ